MTAAATYRPTILYIGFDVGFMDPTRELLVEILGEVGVLTCFGPGYLPEATVSAGLPAFVDAHGPFEILVADENVIQDFERLDRGEDLRFYGHACRFDPTLLRLGRDYQRFLQRHDGLRVLTLMQSDYYNFPGSRIDAIESVADYFVTWGEEFIRPRAAFLDTPTLPGGVNEAVLRHANDNYLGFLQRRRERIISCPQYVAAREACATPLARRPLTWSLLGADYDGRVRARRCIDERGIRRAGNWLRLSQILAGRVGFSVYDKYWTIGLMHWGFRQALRRSRYSFTCGSVLRWPIRKYFELPVNGCVMVCEAVNGFAALGFQDRLNAVTCEAPDILDAHDWLVANPEAAQRIADNGREHVLAQHSVAARARQLSAAFTGIVEGRFRGSCWHDGAFRLTGPPGTPPAGDPG